ncbi:MAG: type IV toxin-antitoxin system AbiEi family antitoxin domain-containing protein [Coriobacteriia bacterium]
MRHPSDSAVQAAEAIFAARGGLMRTRDALAAGVHRRTLYWMRDNGLLEPLARGVFQLASAPYPASLDMAIVMQRTPRAVLCLVSALVYHEIGTQIPRSVQIALPRNVRPPKFDYPPVQVFNMSDDAFEAGTEERMMGSTQVRVFNAAKTIADCFKYRNKIGLDIALEALRETLWSRKATRDEIMKYAQIDRVAKILRPYLEAME